MKSARHRLLWIGGEPASAHFEGCAEWQLQLDVLAGAPALHQLQQGRCVLLAIDGGAAETLMSDETQSLIREAVSHGLKVIASCSYADTTVVAAALHRWRLHDWVEITLHGSERKSIEKVAYLKHQLQFNIALAVEGVSDLTQDEAILLNRAFSDCSAVKLVPQATGSAKVFCAFASLENSRVGPLPLPFFVKFDTSEMITRELRNYEECTTLHVPFNQRPNLDFSRCLVSYSTGVIVGNFVEQSESLSEVIDRGSGRDALHSLFEGALRGWRRQAFYDDDRYLAEGNILDRLHWSCPLNYNKGRQRRLRERQQSIGSGASGFDELEAMLRALPPFRFRFGMTHGDLHGNNVRVSGRDAILIDFASVAEGPLTVDPAALDVSLMMDTERVTGDDWIRLADSIYSETALRPPAVPPRPEHPAANLLDALQYIRQIAFAVTFSDLEYPLTVALQLLRKASYKGDSEEQERRRIHAYHLADRIIRGIPIAATTSAGKTAA